jgi:hypothetical protein
MRTKQHILACAAVSISIPTTVREKWLLQFPYNLWRDGKFLASRLGIIAANLISKIRFWFMLP